MCASLVRILFFVVNFFVKQLDPGFYRLKYIFFVKYDFYRKPQY